MYEVGLIHLNSHIVTMQWWLGIWKCSILMKKEVLRCCM